MIVLPVALLSFDTRKEDHWWIRAVIRAAVMFGLLLLAEIDAAAVLLSVMMYLAASFSAKLYARDLAKNRKTHAKKDTELRRAAVPFLFKALLSAS